MLRRAGTDKTDEEMIHQKLNGKILNGIRAIRVIRGPFETLKIVASLAPKESK